MISVVSVEAPDSNFRLGPLHCFLEVWGFPLKRGGKLSLLGIGNNSQGTTQLWQATLPLLTHVLHVSVPAPALS